MNRLLALPMVSAVVLCCSAVAQENGPLPSPAALQQFFTLPGVVFSDQQQVNVEQLRREFGPRLAENQQRWNGTLTDEQRRARREAFQQARAAGKQGPQLREALEAAVTFTEEQKRQQAVIQEERNTLLRQLRTQLIALLTDEQRARLRPPGQTPGPQISPTHADVKYGPHRRHVMDVWLAESDQPTPVLVSIHGGGFRAGNKSVSGGILKACLDSGVSVMAITYRLSDEAIAPAQFHDAARAIQFIRHNAERWHLDPSRIAATGGSAGAGISLWLGFHEDLADPANEDPVLRQSTRLTCMAVYNGQTSYDPRFIRELFSGTPTYKHPALALLFAVDLDQLDDLPAEKYRLFEEVSALPHLTKDDPPAALFYASEMDAPLSNQEIGIHHPRFGKVLQEKMDALGIECEVRAGIPRGDDWSRLTVDFVKKHLRVE